MLVVLNKRQAHICHRLGLGIVCSALNSLKTMHLTATWAPSTLFNLFRCCIPPTHPPLHYSRVASFYIISKIGQIKWYEPLFWCCRIDFTKSDRPLFDVRVVASIKSQFCAYKCSWNESKLKWVFYKSSVAVQIIERDGFRPLVRTHWPILAGGQCVICQENVRNVPLLPQSLSQGHRLSLLTTITAITV